MRAWYRPFALLLALPALAFAQAELAAAARWLRARSAAKPRLETTGIRSQLAAPTPVR